MSVGLQILLNIHVLAVQTGARRDVTRVVGFGQLRQRF